MLANRSVVITGASTGIGRACALYMDSLGWQVFAGVRRQVDADSLRSAGSKHLTPIFMDVSDAESIRSARGIVEDAIRHSGLNGLVNNAGIAYGGPVEFLDMAELRRLFDINFFGVVAVTQAFLPLLRRGHGRIVNMSSTGGMNSSPMLSPYTASKFALEALSDALRVELHPWGMHVAVVQPGAIDTPIWNKGFNTTSGLLEHSPQDLLDLYSSPIEVVRSGLEPHGIPPLKVAIAVAHALTSAHPKTRYPVGRDAAVVRFFRVLPDRLRDAVFIARFWKRR